MKRIIAASVFLLSLSAFAQEREVQQSTRQESLKSWEISFGAMFPTSRAYPKKNAHYSIGLGYIWDIDVAFVEARIDHSDRFSGDPTQRYTSATIGGNYIILDQDVWALFGGLNVGLGFAKVQGVDAKGGFHIGADIGTLFLRNADVNFDTRMRIAYNTADIHDSHPFFFGIIAGLHF